MLDQPVVLLFSCSNILSSSFVSLPSSLAETIAECRLMVGFGLLMEQVGILRVSRRRTRLTHRQLNRPGLRDHVCEIVNRWPVMATDKGFGVLMKVDESHHLCSPFALLAR